MDRPGRSIPLGGKTGARSGVLRRVGRWLVRVALGLVLLWLGLIIVYRWIDPPITPLMLLRLPEAGHIDHRPVPLAAISRALQEAVIASEDNRFCLHHGIDWGAVSDAVNEYDERGRLRGASTITMQTARNLFLWPGGGFLRKGVEAGLALTIELFWSKRRIMEVYLNDIEWSLGVYGAEAAAEHFFHRNARTLTRREAALMAAVLPNPRHWSPAPPDRYIASRASVIEARMGRIEGYFECLRGGRQNGRG
jgi:monofunctional biosynthetic peptidoglycan transglycosylase